MLIRQRGPLGIFFVLDHKGNISMFMLTLVSNVVPEYITPPVILCHIIFLSLILGCYSWLCLILWLLFLVVSYSLVPTIPHSADLSAGTQR